MIKNFLTKLLASIGKLYLQTTPEPSDKLKKQYLHDRERIINLYSQPLYWHGTGRYHHGKSEGKVIDVLDEIIKNHGLKPLVKDPWLKAGNDYRYTISLANIRMYASVYALIHQDQSYKLPYIYGSRFFWSFMTGLNNFIKAPLDIIYHALLFTFKKKRKQIAGFQSKVRKGKKLKNLKTFVLQLMYMPFIRSDIKGNYPIIFAVKRKNLRFINLDSGFSYYEARTENPVTFEDVSHIEVPYSKIGETEALLKKKAIDISIISIESAEIFAKETTTVLEQLLPSPNVLISDLINEKVTLPYFKSIDKFQNAFAKKDKYHAFAHALRCYFFAGLICSEIKDVDKDVVTIAALLHDIGKESIFSTRYHGKKSSNWIKRNLTNFKIGLSTEQISKISKLCEIHVYPDSKSMPLEVQIIKDADSLDRWRLALNKTKEKFLRLKVSRKLNPVLRDFIFRYSTYSNNLTEVEKLLKAINEFGVEEMNNRTKPP